MCSLQFPGYLWPPINDGAVVYFPARCWKERCQRTRINNATENFMDESPGHQFPGRRTWPVSLPSPEMQRCLGRALEKCGLAEGDLSAVRDGRAHQAQAALRLKEQAAQRLAAAKSRSGKKLSRLNRL